MICRVSRLSGTFGSRKAGNTAGSSPMSPTVRSGIPVIIATMVRAMMQTRADGTALVTRGSR